MQCTYRTRATVRVATRLVQIARKSNGCNMMNLMSLSFRAQKHLALWVLALGIPAFQTAQATFVPQATNYAITEPLVGDQAHPSLALGAGGGFLVWEDNRTDGSGSGISAIALDAGFSKVFSTFRINADGVGDQVMPKASLLKAGGAVFTWLGGRPEARQVYARFMSKDNTWSTGDVRVAGNTNRAKAGAVVTTLNNSNVVVVWASFNQVSSNSMADIYGQLLTPSGQKVGAEFQINQFAKYNQRAPAVAALKNGGFAVAWVSEQQRVEIGSPSPVPQPSANLMPSVDIYARLYTSAGVASGSEFLVNTDNAICSEPQLAAGDSGFLAVWSEKHPLRLTNGWDIAARSYSSAGVGGVVSRLNAFLPRDQFSPSIAAAGSEYFAVWTSMGQDGSREGTFGRFIAADGAPEGDEISVNTTVVSQQMQPVVGSDGTKFVAAWSSFTGVANSFDLFAQRYAQVLEPLAAMNAPFVYVPFNVSAGAYQTAVQVSWAVQAGLPVDHYEVYVDGSATPSVTTTTNIWIATGLTAGSTHTFQVAYVANDQRRSPLSAASSATLWNGFNWGGIPFEWMSTYYGADTANWPAAGSKVGGTGPTLASIFLSGANPLLATTWLKVRITHSAQGPFLNWNPQAGLVYQPQTSTNLVNWANLGGPRFAAGAADSMLVGGNRAAYYRVLRLR